MVDVITQRYRNNTKLTHSNSASIAKGIFCAACWGIALAPDTARGAIASVENSPVENTLDEEVKETK